MDDVSGVDIDTLRNNQKKSWNTNISTLYQFVKGTYRIRVAVHFSALDENVKDMYADWYYFKCNRDIKWR